MIELFFKIRGGNAPPALPVADPMSDTLMYVLNSTIIIKAYVLFVKIYKLYNNKKKNFAKMEDCLYKRQFNRCRIVI